MSVKSKQSALFADAARETSAVLSECRTYRYHLARGVSETHASARDAAVLALQAPAEPSAEAPRHVERRPGEVGGALGPEPGER